MRNQNTLIRLLIVGALAVLCTQMAVAGDLDGKWRFVFSNADGDYPRVLTLKTDGSAVSAKLGEETFKGTFKNGQIEMEGDHYADEAGYTSTLKISCKLEGKQIKGTATWDTFELSVVADRAD